MIAPPFLPFYPARGDEWCFDPRAGPHCRDQGENAAADRRPFRKNGFTQLGSADCPGAPSCHSGLRPDAPRGGDADAASSAIRSDKPFSLATAGESCPDPTGRIKNSFDGVFSCSATVPNEPNLDGSSD